MLTRRSGKQLGETAETTRCECAKGLSYNQEEVTIVHEGTSERLPCSK
jgi:hypothetical protein